MDRYPEVSPLVVTLGLDPESLEKLEGYRRRFFPPERNLVPAHLSLFHQLPDVAVGTFRKYAAGIRPFPLNYQKLVPTRMGMHIEVISPPLLELHRKFAREFRMVLIPQDRQKFRAHITIMNKAPVHEAAAAFAKFNTEFIPWEGQAQSIEVWRYLNGPWKHEASIKLSAHRHTTNPTDV